MVCCGTYCYQFLLNHDLEVDLYSHKDVDICNINQLEPVIASHNIIINCAAYTNVDKAEIEINKCKEVNSVAVLNLAKLCRKYYCKFIHISTDFVYGDVYGKTDYKELFEDDILNPVNIYRKY